MDSLELEFDQAFLNFQLKCGKPPKDKQSKYHKYSSLDSIIDTVKPALNAEGITVQQESCREGVDMVVYTILRYKGIERRSKGFPIPVNVNGQMSVAQSVGSDNTYGRRYSLSTFTAVVSDEDLDGDYKTAKPAPKGEVRRKTTAKKIEEVFAGEQTLQPLLEKGLALAKKFEKPEQQKFWENNLQKKFEANDEKNLTAMIASIEKQVKK